jgi:hypothetical protein
MRKQYHFRHSEQGLLAWDVHNLIRYTQDLAVVEIPLESIAELDEPYWYSFEGDVPTCRSIAEHMQLVEAADIAYPIIICPAGKIMDGMHRVIKSYLAGYKSIKAYRLPVLPQPDYVGVDPDDLPYD